MSLIGDISAELSIARGHEESSLSWESRVVYSAIGNLAVASLYDVQEDGAPVSVQHFKARVDELRESYLSVFPELSTAAILKPEISGEIYSIMLNAGCIYHSPNRITASAFSSARVCGVEFIRGAPAGLKVCTSGLGNYLLIDEADNKSSIASMFGLQRNTLDEYFAALADGIEFDGKAPATAEYLRTKPPFTNGYFCGEPGKDSRISMMRTGFPGSYLYYLYRFEQGKIFAGQIPAWMTDNYEYRIISNSILNARGTLPPSIFRVDGDIVLLRLRYLYPPAELNLLRLYSWPENLFSYTLSRPVFMAIKQELERIGYILIEE